MNYHKHTRHVNPFIFFSDFKLLIIPGIKVNISRCQKGIGIVLAKLMVHEYSVKTV